MRYQFLTYFIFASMLFAANFDAHAKKGEKVILCRIPNGDFSRAKEIIVSQKAAERHIARGSTEGLCLNAEEDATDPSDGESTDTEQNADEGATNPSDGENASNEDDQNVQDGSENGSEGSEPTHDDGTQNPDESDVGCGGASAPRCEVGQACEIYADCESYLCQYNICVNELIPEPTDTNNEWDGDESDVDCGGSSEYLCENGQMCDESTDCESGNCEENLCIEESATEESASPATEQGNNSPAPNSVSEVATPLSGGCDQGSSGSSQSLIILLGGIFAFILLKRKQANAKQ